MASIQFIQAQSFALQASGASLGDTSITLQSFKLSDGVTNITTAMLGDRCYGTLEPNNGTQEEAIQFTGVTQNANGTATLTGVSSVGFVTPYTVTSGLSKSHAGGITFILSNDAAFYNNIISYVNTVVASGAAFASDVVAGVTKLSVAPATGSNPIAFGLNDSRVLSQANANYINSVVNTGIPYAIATGTASAYTATLASSVSSLASGTFLNFLVPTTNASGVTLNVNSLGAKLITKGVNTVLASGDVTTGQVVPVVYDGTTFQMKIPATAFTGSFSSGLTTHDVSTTTSTIIAHGLGVIPKIVRLTATNGGTTSGTTSYTCATYVNGIQNGVYNANDGGTNTGTAAGSGFIIYGTGVTSAANGTRATGTITVDSTNITISWSNGNSPTGTANILWETIG